MRSFVLDRDKFDRLVHYIIAMCPDTAKLGSTKLHKILWKSDTGTYKLEAKPITGATYKKRPFGPATDELLASRERLKASGAINFWRDDRFAGKKEKDVYTSLRRPDVSFLSSRQRETVDYWIKEICLKHTAESISEETHGFSWQIHELGQVLPMVSVFIDELPEDPDDDGRKWANDEVRRLASREV